MKVNLTYFKVKIFSAWMISKLIGEKKKTDTGTHDLVILIKIKIIRINRLVSFLLLFS